MNDGSKVEFGEQTVYVFVRDGLTPAQDDIQSNHACFHLGMIVGCLRNNPGRTEIPYLVTCEKMKMEGINRALKKCLDNDVLHYLMFDTDVSIEPTCLVVIPLEARQKQLFKNYRLRKYASVVPIAEQPAPKNGLADQQPSNKQQLADEGPNPSAGVQEARQVNCS